MSATNEQSRDGNNIDQLRTALTNTQQENAVLTTKVDLLTRSIEDLRAQNYRLEAQNTECRIGRAASDERASAAREAAARAQACCSCGCHPCGCGSALSQRNPSGRSTAGTSTGTGNTGHGSQSAAKAQKRLIVDYMIVHETPQKGDWQMCFMASAQGGAQNIFNIPNQTYSGDGIRIDMNCALSPVAVGENVSFKCQLDNDVSTVCSTDASDKSFGEFTACDEGTQNFTFDNWSYILHWYMESA